MMDAILEAARSTPGLLPFTTTEEVVNCHHNYVSKIRFRPKHLIFQRCST
jgi:hypothetical protein